MLVQAWQQLVESPPPHSHVVQIYRDEEFLRRAVAAWFAPVLRQGGGALLACTPEHGEMVRYALWEEGIDAAAMEERRWLVILDADGLMARFMAGDEPDGAAFKRLLAERVRSLREACGGETRPVRVWGEMVDLLWKRGNLAGAQQLERLWNDVIQEHGIRLLCAYQVDNLDPATHPHVLRDVCASHTHLIPEEDDVAFESAVSRALVEVVGEEEAGSLWRALPERRGVPVQMPHAEAVLVLLHHHHPEIGQRVLLRTKAHLARAALR